MREGRRTIRLVHITTVPQSLLFFTEQINYMGSRGFEIHALSSPGERLAKFADQAQVPAYPVEMTRRVTIVRDLVALFYLWRKLSRLRPQVVHASTPKGGLLGIISAWLGGTPVRIYHILGLPLMTATGHKHFLLKWSEKVACLLAHRVLCVSQSVRDVAVADGLCPADKIKVLVNGSVKGVDAAGRFNPAHVGGFARQAVRAKYGIPEEALVVGFAGRIVRDKGLMELVSAMKVLVKEFPNLHLLVAGEFEPQDPVPRDTEAWLRNDCRIHLAGIVEAPLLYAALDILALPTYREGFPSVVIEASAMELPVVTTRIPGCVDTVQEGLTGMLVPPRDAKALEGAIRIYLKDPELRRRHGQAGREWVLMTFRPEAIWEAFYQECLSLLKEQNLPVPQPVSDNREAVTTSRHGRAS